MVWQMIQKIVWQMIQIWGGKRYKKDVANDTKYGVADDRMADETQPLLCTIFWYFLNVMTIMAGEGWQQIRQWDLGQC